MTAQEKEWLQAQFDQVQIRQIVLLGYLREALAQTAALRRILVALRQQPGLTPQQIGQTWDQEVLDVGMLHQISEPDLYKAAALEFRSWKQDMD